MAGFNFDTDFVPPEPWEFNVTVGGVTYPTREPSTEELAALDAAHRSGEDIGGAREFIGRVGGHALAAALTFDMALAMLAGLLTYVRVRSERHDHRTGDAERLASRAATASHEAIVRHAGLLN